MPRRQSAPARVVDALPTPPDLATEPRSPEPETAPAEAPAAPPDPYALRRALAAQQVQRDLDRFAARHWALDYPLIRSTSQALLLTALFTEHATCPHCGVDSGVRLPQSEAEARNAEIQHLLLEREYADACVRADLAAFTSPAARAAAAAMQPPAPDVQVEGANAPVRVHMVPGLMPPATRPPLALARAPKRRKRA